MLLDAAKELIGVEFVFAGSRAAQQPNVQNNHIAASGLDAIENVSQVIEIEVIAHRHEDVSGPRANGLGRQFGLQLQIQLVHLHLSRAAFVGSALGNRKTDKEQHGESAARHGGHRLGEKIDDGDEEKNQCDQAEADGDLHAANIEIKWDLEFAHSGPRVSQHEHG